MARVTHVYTVQAAAHLLGEDPQLIEDVAIDMGSDEGAIIIVTADEETITGFTNDGIDSLVDYLREFKARRPAT